MTLISIIVPTTRPDNRSLETIFRFEVPIGYELEFLFIIDDPNKNLSELLNIIKKNQKFSIRIIKNAKNIGTSASRNKGIEDSLGDYILFIDDDCIVKSNLLLEYIKALEIYPNYPGYIGVTNTPQPNSSFEHAIELSDMLHFFKIAKLKEEFYWGITANLFIKREAIGDIRFPLEYPKKGGGEDIHFCLKIIESYFKNSKEISQKAKNLKFKCVPTAEIIHPFWKENVKNYIRYYRWGYGDVLLHKKFPQYCFHQYPNYLEYLFFLTCISILITFIFLPLINLSLSLFQLIGILMFNYSFMTIWEIFCESIKLKSQNRRFSSKAILKAVLIRQLNDAGRFIHQFPKIWKFTNRWDYFCSGESIKYERINALKKLSGFIVITFFSIIIMIVLS